MQAKLFKIKKTECPYILGAYCNHPEGPILCQEGDEWPDGCPGENDNDSRNRG